MQVDSDSEAELKITNLVQYCVYVSVVVGLVVWGGSLPMRHQPAETSTFIVGRQKSDFGWDRQRPKSN